MKVLVVTNLYPPHSLGGYEMSCRDTVDRWVEAGHEVDVLTTTTTFHDTAADPAEPQVHRSLDWYWVDHRLIRPKPTHRLRIERANHRLISQHLQSFGPDVVSFWAMGGMSMGLIAACIERAYPVVAVIEDDWLVYGPKADPWTAAWQRRPKVFAGVAGQLTGLPTDPPTLGEGSIAVFASHYLLDKARAEGVVSFADGRVVHLGIDGTDFPARRKPDRPWSWRLLLVGRIDPRKGFDIAIRALAALPEATLQIVGGGDGRHRDELLALATELGVADRVEMIGGVDRDTLADVYAAADVALFLSRWDEPFGLVPLEAMTQATPVVATRRGGSAEFLTDKLNCLEVPVDDPDAVAKAVSALASDAALRQRLVNGGLTTVTSYRVERFADQLEAIHLEVAKSAPAGTE